MNKNIDMLATGKFLEESFTRIGMTNADVAKHFEVSFTTAYYWTTGKKMPSIKHLVNIADLLGCTLDDIVKVM